MLTKRTLIIATSVLLAAASVASAHDQRRSDANDNSDRLDLKAVSLSHTSSRIKIDFRTYQTWAASALQSGKRTLYTPIDTKGDNEPDFNVNILKTDSGLACIVGKEPNGERVGRGRVSRNSQSHIACSFRRGMIDAGGSKTIRWQGWMVNLETFIQDRVPDQEMASHSL